MDRRLQETNQEIRFRIDATRCDGQGVCVLIAPEVFQLDRYGLGYVVPGADVTAANPDVRNRALEAGALCPRNAISEQIVQASTAPTEVEDDSVRPAAETPNRLHIGERVESLDERITGGGFADLPADRILDMVRAAHLRGQGGAGFATATKWQLVGREKPVVVLNGSEREPGTVKDRYLLGNRPALVLDGLRLAARAVGAEVAVAAIDAEATEAAAVFRATAEDAASRGLLDELEIRFVEVPPSYVAGEETALLGFIENGRPVPRVRPPFPSEVGLHGRPTLVNNVETLAGVALAAALGPEEYRCVGTSTEPGTGLYTVGPFGGPFELAERPIGYPLRALLAETGYAAARAALVGGYAGALVTAEQFDVRLDNASLRGLGAALGTKSVQVLGAGQCPVRIAAEILEYFAGETADQCPPCSRGLPDMAATLRALENGTSGEISLPEFEQFMSTLFDRGVCRLPDGAARMALSLLRNFEHEVKAHLAHGCPQLRAGVAGH
ncbi:NADH-ubiquinone oxidoreductase-F iron-sulfur binding region domain-containing protein [Acrocarpospora macrocephala]|uniref:NADH dehydrogenase n=1 Tax=Acrocarpospora macrocephala TaxID=150177 RepID=A0A5M3WNC4_9ACTN|nr:NADH-ubiquinone oxidoreductase-F iron-sulfur binding region domain-containing protein [Acrocarpospora macrocephala]GES09602.1 NADH dehydrogenase [Acrocarpospora macrocephala]